MSERTSYFGFLVATGLVLGALVGIWISVLRWDDGDRSVTVLHCTAEECVRVYP